MAALSEEAYAATYEAAEKCTIVVFSAESLERLMRDEPDVMMSVIRTLTKRMTELVTTIKTLASDVPTRVAIYVGQRVDEHSATQDGRIEVELGVTRVELAAVLGTVPETLSRAFHLLQSEGILESDGRHVTVLDRQALHARARGII
jgi:CRP/FNR family transcriptional regulator